MLWEWEPVHHSLPIHSIARRHVRVSQAVSSSEGEHGSSLWGEWEGTVMKGILPPRRGWCMGLSCRHDYQQGEDRHILQWHTHRSVVSTGGSTLVALVSWLGAARRKWQRRRRTRCGRVWTRWAWSAGIRWLIRETRSVDGDELMTTTRTELSTWRQCGECSSSTHLSTQSHVHSLHQQGRTPDDV